MVWSFTNPKGVLLRALITSDWHLSGNPRDTYRLNWFNSLSKLLRKHKATSLIVLGDLTEEKDEHSSELVNAVVAGFCRISQEVPVVLLRGNHDYWSSADKPFFQFLDLMRDIYWINEPSRDQATPQAVSVAVGNAWFLPYTASYKRDWASLKFGKEPLIFAHQCFAGATSDSGFKLDGIPLSVFPEDATIISGDIHRAQEFENCTYVGSPFSVDFGDQSEPRVLLIEDLGRKIKSIPCDGPQKRLVEINSLSDLDKQSVNAGDILKVRMNLKREDAPNWPKLANKIRAWGEENNQIIHAVQPVFEAQTKSMVANKRVARKPDEQLLKEYGAYRAVDEQTLKAGMKLL